MHTNRIAHWLKTIPAWAWPRTCLVCRAATGAYDFCAPCLATLPRAEAACPRCAVPVAGARECGRCLQRPPPFVRTVSAFSYQAPIAPLILQLKYHEGLAVARALAPLLAQRVAPFAATVDAIVPVPLHPSRVRARGFNQALEIARPLARELSLPLRPRWAQRVRATAHQTELTHTARARNVRRAFRASADVNGKRIAVVDDVMTSGHTVTALAQALRAAGAAEIQVWVLARA